MFLTRIREQSSYLVIRSFLGIVRDVGRIIGMMLMLGGVLLGFFATSGTFISFGLGLVYAAAACIAGLVLIGLSLAGYQASIVIVDIADTLIDERIK